MKIFRLKLFTTLFLLSFCFSLVNAAERDYLHPQTRMERMKAWAWIMQIAAKQRLWNIADSTKQFFLNKTGVRTFINKYVELSVSRLRVQDGETCSICREQIICAADKKNVVASIYKLFSLLKKPEILESEENKLIIPLHFNPYKIGAQVVHWVHLKCLANQYFNRENIVLEIQRTPLTHEDIVAQKVADYRQRVHLSDLSDEELLEMAETDVSGAGGLTELNIEEIQPKVGHKRYNECPICRSEFSSNERLIVEHYLDVTGPSWIEREFNPNWLVEYENHVKKVLINSIEACDLENAYLYQDFCESKNIPKKRSEETGAEYYDHADVAALLLISEQVQRARRFNFGDELNKQRDRCRQRFNHFGLSWDTQYPVYYLFMKQLGPYFKGDAKNLVRYYDLMNKTICPFRSSQLVWPQLLIYQIPVIYKFNPDLIGGVGLNQNYIDKKTLLDGFYNVYFGRTFSDNPNHSFDQLMDALNQRYAFEENFLKLEITDFNKYFVHMTNYILDEDASKIEAYITKFKQNKDHFIIWLLSTHDQEDPTHKICILIRKNAQQQVEFIIADSLAKDRRQSEVVQKLYRKYFLPQQEQR